MRESRVGSEPREARGGCPTADRASLTRVVGTGKGRSLHLTRAVGTLETGTPVTAPPPPPGVRLRSAGMPRAQPDRSAPGGVGIPARRPTSSLTIFPLAAGRHRYSPRGAGVTPENFPWRGCAGDFHSPLRGLRSEAVLGRHLGLSRDRGWGWRTPFPPFPLTPLHTPRRSGRLALHSYFPSGLRWVGGFAWAEDFRFWGTPPF